MTGSSRPGGPDAATDPGASGPCSRVARVLLDSTLPQLDHLFDYAIPAELAPLLRAGQRVRVPFRSQRRTSLGTVIELASHSDFPGELAPIAEIVSEIPQLLPEVWRLARAVADRAGGSAGDILRLAIPRRMVRAEARHLAARSTGAPGHAGETAGETAGEVAGDAASLGRSLVAGERFALTVSHSPERLATGEWVGSWAVRLAETALAVFASGHSVILVVPDYRDLDQLHDSLRALGHADVVRVDSRQSGTERYAAFLRALDPVPRVVLGNRSAVYAPAHRLGAILLWDDGDPLLAEPLTPYVHARDAALIRAEQAGAGLLFAAHSRSAEVQRLVELRYVNAQTHPPRRTRVVHADASIVPEALPGRVPEFAARAIREGLDRGPVLVQVASPGFSPLAVCADCGELGRCSECGGPIAFRSARRGACRWCGNAAAGWRCPACSGARLVERGAGSVRTAEQFERQFAGARVLLSDGEHPRERIDGRPALVVATRGAEPIAAGGYRVVVLLDAGRMLGIESLRAGEDCLRWWENAAALAAPDGRCVLASGGGPVVRAFLTGRSEEWLRSELRERRALRFPPAVRAASVIGGSEEVARALDALGSLPGVDVLGPVPLPDDPALHRSAADGAGAGVPAGGRDPDPPRPSGEPRVRAIVRFDYAVGAEVARRLRAALVADAAGASARGRRGARRPRESALRLRFDDRGVFDG